jgi:hypothetical protein
MQRVPPDLLTKVQPKTGDNPAQGGDFTVMFRVPTDAQYQGGAVAPEPPKAGADEFTAMFRAPALSPEAADEEPAVVVRPAQPPPKNAGEFTSMFRTPAAGTDPVPNGTPEPQPTSAPAPESAGEFTAMFRAPAVAAPSKPAASEVVRPPQAADKSADEFTAMFGTPAVSADVQSGAPPAVSKPVASEVVRPPRAAEKSPDEVTAMVRPPAAPAPPKPVEAALPLQPATEAGEFTAMFRTPEEAPSAPSAKQTPESLSGDDSQAKTPAPPQSINSLQTQVGQASACHDLFPAASKDGGSEFTSMFRTPPPPSTTQAVRTRDQPSETKPILDSEATRLFSSVPQAPPSSAPPAQAPGEFTRLFQAPGAPSVPASPVHPPPPAQASDFDRFFNAPYSSDPEAEKRLRGEGPPVPQGPSMLGPGDFTRVFGQKESVGGPAAPPSATGAFATPGPLGGLPAEEPVSSGPSEYTKLFQTPAAPAPVSAPEPPPAPAPAAVQAPSQISRIILYVALGLLACAGIATVLYFALRH